MAIVLPSLGQAQDTPPNRAALVIRHGDGRVVTACVQFREPSINGIELLDRAGVSYLAQSGGTGAAVCQLDGEGCNYPAEDCFCHCKGADCFYWAYQRLIDGTWRYSSLGAKSTTVRPGDVDGWAWGSGSVQAGAQPPALSFEQVCTQAVLTPPTEATPPPAPTEVAPPPAPPAPTEVAPPPPSPTPAVRATRAPAPSPRPRPTRTPLPAATSAATTVATPAASATANVESTTEARPTEGHAPATVEPATTSPFPSSGPTATIGPAGGAAPTRPAPPQGQAGSTASYLVFGALALLLVGGIVAAALRRRSDRAR